MSRSDDTAPRPPATPLERDLATLGRCHATAPAEPVVLPTRPKVTIVRVGDVVVKAHAASTSAAALRARLSACARLGAALLQPLTPEVIEVRGRPVTLWPTGEPVNPDDPDTAPWEEGARLLAALHAVPLADLPPLPPAGGPARVAATVARLDGDPSPEAKVVREAAARLPRAPAVPAGLVHGDWHLGQLVRHPPGGGRWLLIDVDDLGHGDQAWDLARPAAWFAAGLLDPAVWERFLSAYRAAGGRALAGVTDPWERLDGPARALTVQLTATALVTARGEERPIDEVETILVETCRRITGL